MKSQCRIGLVVGLIVACGSSSNEPEERYGKKDDQEISRRVEGKAERAETLHAETCLGTGVRCGETDLECCEGTFCSAEINGYQIGACQEPLPIGGYCQKDAHCASGHCVEFQCRDPAACLAEGGDCYGRVADCCDGLFCDVDLNAYGVGKCVLALADGHYCQDDVQCKGGHCTDNLCSGSCASP